MNRKSCREKGRAAARTIHEKRWILDYHWLPVTSPVKLESLIIAWLNSSLNEQEIEDESSYSPPSLISWGLVVPSAPTQQAALRVVTLSIYLESVLRSKSGFPALGLTLGFISNPV